MRPTYFEKKTKKNKKIEKPSGRGCSGMGQKNKKKQIFFITNEKEKMIKK